MHAHLDHASRFEHLARLIAFVGSDLQPQRRAKFFLLRVLDIDVAIFRRRVATGRAVAILAAVANQVRRFLQTPDNPTRTENTFAAPSR